MLFESSFTHFVRNHCFQVACRFFLGVLIFLLAWSAFAADSDRSEPIPDVIVHVASTTAGHRFLFRDGAFVDLPGGCLLSNSPCEYPNAGRLYYNQQDSAKFDINEYKNVLPTKVGWAFGSADKKRIVYGLDRAFRSSGLELFISLSAEKQVIYSDRDPDSRISCVRWSPDSKMLFILEVKHRLSLTPLSLFAALAGHGATVDKYTLRVISFESDGTVKVQRFPLPQSFEESLACLDEK